MTYPSDPVFDLTNPHAFARPDPDEQVKIKKSQRVITVCRNCLTESCWNGNLMCDRAKTAGTITDTEENISRIAQPTNEPQPATAEGEGEPLARFALSGSCDNAAHSRCPYPERCLCDCHKSTAQPPAPHTATRGEVFDALVAALQPIAKAYPDDPGTSDLYDEQPVSITLGDVRRAWAALRFAGK